MPVSTASLESQRPRSPSAPAADRTQARHSRRAAIREFFLAHLGERFASAELHARFGSAFRTRVSEINRDLSSDIHVFNETSAAVDDQGHPCERSNYWSELRAASQRHSGRAESEYVRREREERERAMPLFAEAR